MVFHFQQPHWLWIGALVCAAIVLLLARAARLRRQALTHFAGARATSSLSPRRRLIKQALTIAGLAALFVALARPVAGFRWEKTQRQAIDLMFAVDTSKSMRATDLRPDRLTRAKLAVTDLLRAFPGERVGLIAFAGDAFVQAPMTTDTVMFQQALDALDTDVIARGGTDIATAIRTASLALASEPAHRKLLVILSDGEDLEGNALTAAQQAAAQGLVIYTVGVGSPEGELIPSVNAEGRPDLKRDATGQPVRSRLDEATLRKLAQITGGAYAPLGPGGGGLQMLYRQHLANLPRYAVQERQRRVYTERFTIPLAVALGCLLLALVIDERRRDREGRGAAAALGLIVLGLGGSPGHAQAALAVPGAPTTSPVAEAQAAPAGAEAKTGSRAARKDAPAPVTYNQGTEAYRRRDFDGARAAFQAATRTTDLKLQTDAYYDLGNARYRVGQASLAKDPEATRASWKGAIEAYDGVLALQPHDADARFNRDLVARKLKALDQQENQKDQKSQNSQAPKDQEQKSRSQQQNGGGGSAQKDQKGGQGQPGQQDQQDQQGQRDQQQQANQPGQPAQANQQPASGQPKQGTGQPGQQAQAVAQPQPGPAATPASPKAEAPKNGAGAQPGDEPKPARPGAQVSGPAGGSTQADADGAAEANRRGTPGALSRDEAAQLLDSVAGELQRLPTGSARRETSPNRSQNEPVKDW